MVQEVLVGQPAQKRGITTNPVGLGTATLEPASAPTPALDDKISAQNIHVDTVPQNVADHAPKSPTATEFMIRTLDIVGSLAIVILTFPAMLVVTLLIWISSPGSIIYKQRRVGKDGKIFTLYKFRTMVNHADKIWGLIPASQDDERITSVGRILRRTRLDELPQLFNVLTGNMSLVGPRPENIYRINLHPALRGARLVVKPGLTGLAQIRGYYDLKPEHKIRYDYLYIQKRSLLLNIYLLIQTIPVIFLKRGW